MAETFFNQERFRTFGLNVRIPERTLKQAGATLGENAKNIVSPLFDYLEENDEVFTGNVANEIRKINLINFNIGAMMQFEDKSINGDNPSFDTHF
jgi:hypothetical protein